jgi:hypothetical protein
MAAIVQNPRAPLPWSGPRAPMEEPPTFHSAEHPAPYPITSAENPNMFPPVCIRSHWDAENIIRRTLPTSLVSLPLEPRPLVKVCMNYTTSAPFQMAPHPHESVVFPSGGTFYPPTRYRNAADKESELKRLDRPLGMCEKEQFVPTLKNESTVPDRGKPNDRFIQELAFPMALMRSEPYGCRRENDLKAIAINGSLFNNPTKHNRNHVP